MNTVRYTMCAICCLDGRQEKPARASLFTAMQRAIGKDTIVIVDGMNYIKGYRYQMYCAAREHRLRVCTVSASDGVHIHRGWRWYSIHSQFSSFFCLLIVA